MKRLLAALPLLLLIASACAVAPSPDRPWTAEDLRLLDPVDAEPSAPDILAVYTRAAGSDVQIRIDLLDSGQHGTANGHLELHLTWPGRELTVHLPFDGAPSVTPPDPNLVPRLVFDPVLSTLTVSFNRQDLPEPFELQVDAYLDGASQPEDRTAWVRSDGEPPSSRARVLLAFWDDLPALTPLQALRSWDGAHTGPNGGRHGLNLLVSAAAQNHIPIALLDLKTPASLAALDFLGRTKRIQALAATGELLLPDAAWSSPGTAALALSRESAAGFGLPASPFVYAADGSLQGGAQAQFIDLPDAYRLGRSGATLLIPLPITDPAQVGTNGPYPTLTATLIAAALSDDPARLVVLGGDVAQSAWADGDTAAATFAWLAGHPWVHALTGAELLTFPVVPGNSPTAPPAAHQGQAAALADLPHNPLGTASALNLLTMNAPVGGDLEQALRNQYAKQVVNLEMAAGWAAQPKTRVGCALQANAWNGISPWPDCVLANDRFYAQFEPMGGRLIGLYYRDASGGHQLVAPTSQFAVGLSDPSTWGILLGEQADPGVIPGAFADTTVPWVQYRPSVQGATLTLTSPDGRTVKTFTLTESGLQVTIQAPGALSLKVPLVVDPADFYLGPSDLRGSLTAGTWTFGPTGGPQVVVRSDAGLSAATFSEARASLADPEDPNANYPSGIHLPFPVSVVTLTGDGLLHASIGVR